MSRRYSRAAVRSPHTRRWASLLAATPALRVEKRRLVVHKHRWKKAESPQVSGNGEAPALQRTRCAVNAPGERMSAARRARRFHSTVMAQFSRGLIAMRTNVVQHAVMPELLPFFLRSVLQKITLPPRDAHGGIGSSDGDRARIGDAVLIQRTNIRGTS